MKKILLILLFTITMTAQKNSIYRPNAEIVNAEASVIIPLGNLANKFDIGQSYGFWFKMGEHNRLSANIGFNLLFLKNARPVNFTFKDSIYSIDSNKFGLDVGMRVIKIIPISKNNHHYLEYGFTFGIHYLDYDFPKEEKKEEEKETNSIRFPEKTTILLAPEIRYIYKNVGVKLQYKYTPFGIIKELESKFGSSAVSFGIIYKQ